MVRYVIDRIWAIIKTVSVFTVKIYKALQAHFLFILSSNVAVIQYQIRSWYCPRSGRENFT